MDAIRATYADIKTVRTRKVYQIVFEGPIEQMGEAMRLFGPPMPDAEVWAGIARLDLSKTSAAPANEDRPPAKLAQIAGITCNEGGFWRFLAERGDYQVNSAEDAAQYVRLICGVKSRAELDTNVHAARKWRDLKSDYDLWLKDAA